MVELTFKGGPTDYYKTWKEAESAAWALLPKYATDFAVIRQDNRQKTILYSDAIAAMGFGYVFDGKPAGGVQVPPKATRSRGGRSRAAQSKVEQV